MSATTAPVWTKVRQQPGARLAGRRLVLAELLGGAVVTEAVFAYPGIGQLTVNSLNQSDYSVAMAAVMILAVLTVLGNLLADETRYPFVINMPQHHLEPTLVRIRRHGARNRELRGDQKYGG